MDLVRLFDACLHSLWLLPVLAVMIAADGPVPVLPSETILMSAAAAAFGVHDVRGIVGLFAAALVGSIAGDLLAFWLGRSSNRLLPAAAHADSGLGHWVRANLFHRPVVALVGARLLPGGRLVSTAAAGRVGLPLRRFLPGSLVSSAVWSVYMLAVGMLLGPMVGGNPFLSLAAGVAMAVLTAGGFAVIQRLRARRRRGDGCRGSSARWRPPRSPPSRPEGRLGESSTRGCGPVRSVRPGAPGAAFREPGHVDRCRRRLPFHRHRSIAQRSRTPVVVTELSGTARKATSRAFGTGVVRWAVRDPNLPGWRTRRTRRAAARAR